MSLSLPNWRLLNYVQPSLSHWRSVTWLNPTNLLHRSAFISMQDVGKASPSTIVNLLLQQRLRCKVETSYAHQHAALPWVATQAMPITSHA